LVQTGYVEDLTTGYTWSTTAEFDDPTATYTITVYDYDDFDADDFIGSINFTPYVGGAGFPDSRPISCPACVVDLTLEGIIYSH
jgi:hypothetical protein